MHLLPAVVDGCKPCSRVGVVIICDAPFQQFKKPFMLCIMSNICACMNKKWINHEAESCLLQIRVDNTT